MLWNRWGEKLFELLMMSHFLKRLHQFVFTKFLWDVIGNICKSDEWLSMMQKIMQKYMQRFSPLVGYSDRRQFLSP